MILKPRSFSWVLRFGWLSALAFAGGAIATTWAQATTEAESPYAVMQQLARVLVLVENEYVDPVDRARLLDGAIGGMVQNLDPHSSYLPPRDFRTFQADTRGEFGGIGVEVDFRGDEVTVIAAIEGSPAAKAGILPGDRLVAIDGKRVQGRSPEQLVQQMRGAPNTEVRVSVRRKGADSLLHFTLRRQVIEVASVAAHSMVDKIAYLRIKQFQRETHQEFLRGIAEIRQRTGGPIAGVILDLRNNPGGLVREATAIADEFLAEGQIFSTRHRKDIIDQVDASSGGALVSEPLVVLVNEFSASASELLAGALQDNGRASVVGAQTFGKGSVQSIFDLPGNAGLRLTTMRYYTPNGRAIQAQGIRPDVLVEAVYLEDKTFGAVREEDLENHLPAEGTTDRHRPRTSHRPKQPQDEETGISPTHLGVAREIPDDPTGGPDFALSIGFQIVRDVLSRQR